MRSGEEREDSREERIEGNPTPKRGQIATERTRNHRNSSPCFPCTMPSRKYGQQTDSTHETRTKKRAPLTQPAAPITRNRTCAAQTSIEAPLPVLHTRAMPRAGPWIARERRRTESLGGSCTTAFALGCAALTHSKNGNTGAAAVVPARAVHAHR